MSWKKAFRLHSRTDAFTAGSVPDFSIADFWRPSQAGTAKGYVLAHSVKRPKATIGPLSAYSVGTPLGAQ